MVKIVNPLGDVKIGRQGEVVYQRKYGEQIRRMVSPKRAIVSEAQLAHRQLYRDALDWRKQLSRPNRRYLDGYCIANGIVDGYHIPLPWSRFALKLYLQAIKFVPDLYLEAGEAIAELDQQYITGADGQSGIASNNWGSQTFTPSQTAPIPKVALKLYREATPNNFIVEIRTTEGDGSPSDVILASKTFSSEPITQTSPGQFYQFSFDDPPTLTAETLYAIVLHRAPPLHPQALFWRRDASDASYPRGTLYWSTDAGSNWLVQPERDYLFKTYVQIAGEDIKKGTLHVRHPALLTVVQKRGELTVRGYDTLSSLDEEYLTKQVGLDVEEGDSIKATTVAGIEAGFIV